MPCGAWGARRRATVPKCSGNRGLHSCPAYHRERSRIGRPHQNRTTRYDERIGNDGGKEPAPSTRPAASQRTSQRSHYHPTEDQRREDHSPLCGGALGSEQEQRSRRYEGQPEKQAVLASFVERTTAWCDQRDRPDSEGRRDESPAGERRAPHLSAANEEQNRKVPPAIFNGMGSQERKNQERRHVREARSIAAPVR